MLPNKQHLDKESVADDYGKDYEERKHVRKEIEEYHTLDTLGMKMVVNGLQDHKFNG